MGGPPQGPPQQMPTLQVQQPVQVQQPQVVPQQQQQPQPGQVVGPGGPMGQPPMPVGAVLHQVRPQVPQQIQQPGPQPGPPGAFPVHGQRPMLIQQGKYYGKLI